MRVGLWLIILLLGSIKASAVECRSSVSDGVEASESRNAAQWGDEARFRHMLAELHHTPMADANLMERVAQSGLFRDWAINTNPLSNLVFSLDPSRVVSYQLQLFRGYCRLFPHVFSPQAIDLLIEVAQGKSPIWSGRRLRHWQYSTQELYRASLIFLTSPSVVPRVLVMGVLGALREPERILGENPAEVLAHFLLGNDLPDEVLERYFSPVFYDYGSGMYRIGGSPPYFRMDNAILSLPNAPRVLLALLEREDELGRRAAMNLARYFYFYSGIYSVTNSSLARPHPVALALAQTAIQRHGTASTITWVGEHRVGGVETLREVISDALKKIESADRKITAVAAASEI